MRLLHYLRPVERIDHQHAFLCSLNQQARVLQRPFGIIAALCWINFAFNIDPRLHPEFPALFYFRMGLMVAGILVTAVTFVESLRGKGLGLMYLLLVFSFLSCSFFTGRIAYDAGYVSGLQIFILIIIAGPFLFRTILIFYGASIALFISALLIYRPDLSGDAAQYSMNNLAVCYIVGAILGFFLDRFRFQMFYQQMKLNQARDAAEITASSKNQFLSALNQELKIPLESMQALAQKRKEHGMSVKQQMDAIQSILKSLEEITDSAELRLKTMQGVLQILNETVAFANNSRIDLQRMKAVMDQMVVASATISGKLEAIHEKTENINIIISTITKVADQTNLLSLNAAIEAEKAGESGRGFTVVAREIRRLANQTANSIFDIEQSVEGMQVAVTSGVKEMERFLAEIQHGSEDVLTVNAQQNRIIEKVETLSPHFDSVNQTIQQQSEKAWTIKESLLGLSMEMTRSVEALTDIYESVDRLGHTAESLEEEVNRFSQTP